MKFFKKLVNFLAVILVFLIGTNLPTQPYGCASVRAVYLPPQPINLSQKVLNQIIACERLNAVIFDDNDPCLEQLLKFAKQGDLYTIVRIVVFDQGATWQQAQDQNKITALFDTVKNLNRNPYIDEIQLDYIRFYDDQIIDRNKGQYINKLVATLRELSLWKTLSIDVFGRVAEQDDEVIGQSIAGLEPYVDVICPMLYPSHYGLHPHKRRNPYLTIYDGVQKVKAQLKFPKVFIRPYLQAFQYILEGIPYERYLQQQILAAEDLGGGYAFWNSAGDYQEVFAVLSKMPMKKRFRQSF